MPKIAINPNRFVRCCYTGRFYVSVAHRRHARYRSYLRTGTEFGVALTTLTGEFFKLPSTRKKASRSMKKKHQEDKSLRRIQAWDDADFNKKMLEVQKMMNTPMYKHMRKCNAEARKCTRNGKPVVRYVKGVRRKSTGVVRQECDL